MGGGSEVLVVQRRFSNVTVSDTEISPTIEAGGGGEGGNNLPMILSYGVDHVVCSGGNCTAQGPCFYYEKCPTLKAGGVHGVAIMQNITGTLNPGGHPGSYNGQDAYNDMLVVDNGTDSDGIRPSKCRNYVGGVSNIEC